MHENRPYGAENGTESPVSSSLRQQNRQMVANSMQRPFSHRENSGEFSRWNDSMQSMEGSDDAPAPNAISAPVTRRGKRRRAQDLLHIVVNTGASARMGRYKQQQNASAPPTRNAHRVPLRKATSEIFFLTSESGDRNSIFSSPSTGVTPTFSDDIFSQKSQWRPKLGVRKKRIPKVMTSDTASISEDAPLDKIPVQRKRRQNPKLVTLPQKRNRNKRTPSMRSIHAEEIIVDEADLIFPSPQLSRTSHSAPYSAQPRTSSALSAASQDIDSIAHESLPSWDPPIRYTHSAATTPNTRLGQLSTSPKNASKSPPPPRLLSVPTLSPLIGITHSEKSTSPMVHKDAAFKRLGQVVKQIPQELEKETRQLRLEQRMSDKERYKEFAMQSSTPKRRFAPDNEKYHPLTRSSKYCKKRTGYAKAREMVADGTEGILEPYTGKKTSPMREPSARKKIGIDSRVGKKKKQSAKGKRPVDPLELEHQEAMQQTAKLVESVEHALRNIDRATPDDELTGGVERTVHMVHYEEVLETQGGVGSGVGPNVSIAAPSLSVLQSESTELKTQAPTPGSSIFSLLSRFPFANLKNDFDMWEVDEEPNADAVSSTSNDNTPGTDTSEVSLRNVGEALNQPPQPLEEKEPPNEDAQMALIESAQPMRPRGPVVKEANFLRPTLAYIAWLNARPQTSPESSMLMDPTFGQFPVSPRRDSLPTLSARARKKKIVRKERSPPTTPRRRVLDFTKTPFHDDGSVPAPPEEEGRVKSPPTPRYLKEKEEITFPELIVQPDPREENERRRRAIRMARRALQDRQSKRTAPLTEQEMEELNPTDFSTRIPEKIKKRMIYAEKAAERRLQRATHGGF